MMFRSPILLGCFCAVVASAACSDEAGPTATPDAGVAATQDAASAAAANVDVQYGGQSVVVNVAALDRQDYRGSSVVSLSKVWDEAKLGPDLGAVEFDFEGDDGFRPSSRDRCKTKIAGNQLAKGYIIPETRTLLWDDALGLPGCYGVKGVAKVLVTDK